VNAERHIHAAFGKRVEHLAHLVLRLRHGHSVAGYDYNLACCGQN
jgi:hypothetical protein